MLRLTLHKDAQLDLDRMFDGSDDALAAAARISALLEQIKADDNLLGLLLDHDFGDDRSELFHISKWLRYWNQGKDLWRMKVWDLENKGVRYRIVYAYQRGRSKFTILAIAPREFNYDQDHPLTKRILAAYGRL